MSKPAFKQTPTAKSDPVNRAINPGTPIFKVFSTTNIIFLTDSWSSTGKGVEVSFDPSAESTGIHEESFPVDSWKNDYIINYPVYVSVNVTVLYTFHTVNVNMYDPISAKGISYVTLTTGKTFSAYINFIYPLYVNYLH